MSEFLRDLRFGIRLLAKSPVFVITAALLLGNRHQYECPCFQCDQCFVTPASARIASRKPGSSC
jgi:hypothetical protein